MAMSIEDRKRKFLLLNPGYEELSDVLLGIKDKNTFGDFYIIYNLVTGKFIDGLYFNVSILSSRRAILYGVENNINSYKLLLFTNGNLLKFSNDVDFYRYYEENVGLIIAFIYHANKEDRFVTKVKYLDIDTGNKVGEIEIFGRHHGMEYVNIEGYGGMIKVVNHDKEYYINKSGMYTLGRKKLLRKVNGIQQFWKEEI